MHNCFYYFLIFSIFLQVSLGVMGGYKIDSTLQLINEEWIATFLTEKSLLESYEYGVEVLELDVEKVKIAVQSTISENLYFTNYQVGFYFYDCFSMNSCLIGSYRCNSVQILIEITYLNYLSERIVCYELIQKAK